MADLALLSLVVKIRWRVIKIGTFLNYEKSSSGSGTSDPCGVGVVNHGRLLRPVPYSPRTDSWTRRENRKLSFSLAVENCNLTCLPRYEVLKTSDCLGGCGSGCA